LRLLRHSALGRLPGANILAPPPSWNFGASAGAKYSCASSVTVFWRVYWRKILLRVLRHGILARPRAQNILKLPLSRYFGVSTGQNILAPPLSRYFGASTGVKYSGASTGTKYSCASSVACNQATR
jgi:hypothetical protein